MIAARRLQSRFSLSSSTFRRWLYPCGSSPAPAESPLVGSEQRGPILRFFNQAILSQVVRLNDQLSQHYFFNACWFTTHAAVPNVVGGMVDIPLAQTGEGIAECELLKWFVEEGDNVEEFQPLCEVQSDKATIEITSRYKGKVSHILHAPGDIVKVGETLLKMVVEESSSSTVSDGLPDPRPNDDTQQSATSCQASSQHENGSIGVLCTPAVRNIAKEHGININDIKGSGKDGRVLKEDVLNFVGRRSVDIESCPTTSNLVAESLLYEDRKLQLRGFQRTMVKSMTMAARIPHFHYVEEINCDALMELKASFQKENSNPNIKHTFLPFLVKSLSMALSRYPLLNSCFNEDTFEVIVKGVHNIGIAMATPNGLVVPNIKKVQSLSILEITKEISRLQQLAVENKLGQDNVTGGTITVSNIGAIGGKFGSPLINLPEVAIIALGRIQKLPQITDDGTVYPMPIMNVNIGADHRVLDGATVARFCNEWKLLVEKPELLMLHLR